MTCPCGFPLHDGIVQAFSAEWHRAHRDHHLAVFPDVDDGTRRNLEQFIVEAAR